MNRVVRIGRRRRQEAWLTSCAMALVLAVAPHAARGQAFQGTPTVVTGTAGVVTGANSTTITVGSAETVINWAPADVAGTGTIDFLPAGSTATFQARADFTVLNRILPTDAKGNPVARMVALNGTVNSNLIGASAVTAGNVWFYTPTGLIIGPSAVMNVGGLILTTDDIQFTPNDPLSGTLGSIYGPGGLVQFRGPAGSAGLVDVQAGAQLNAVGTISYVAMVAPRIQQAGSVSAERSVGYVAAEQADLTINAGLFDISILAGTTDPNGIVHTGTTKGSQSTGIADVKQISFVALPKTTALTMLLSGSIGYAPALSAANDGSSVVLSAGYDSTAPSSIPSAPAGGISIGNATFNNPLTGYATGAISVAPVAGDAHFLAYTSLNSLSSIDISAGTGARVLGDDSLTLAAGTPGTGGNISVKTSGTGKVTVTNFLSASANSQAMPFLPPPATDAIGGSVLFQANGGTISAAGLTADTTGSGGFDAVAGGKGQGGTVQLISGTGGTISSGTTSLYAEGYGGNSTGTGGDGVGGTIDILDQGGSLDLGGVGAYADSFGGPGDVASGNATGGHVSLSVTSQAQSWTSLEANTNALGGQTGLGSTQAASATGLADAIDLSVTGPGSLSIAGDTNLSTDALMDFGGSAGFAGRAGGIKVNVTGGGNLSIGGTLFAHANASFYDDTVDVNAPISPLMKGGTVSLTADGGSVSAAGFDLGATADGIAAANSAGTSTGGSASVSALNGGTILADDGAGTASLLISANAYGMGGAHPSDAFGGTAQLTASDGSVTVNGTASITAAASVYSLYGGLGSGTGFAATGGTASATLNGAAGTGSIGVNTLLIDASGNGQEFDAFNNPVAFDGSGGSGLGGSAGLTVDSGTFTTGATVVTATGSGGTSVASSGPSAFQSGGGTGGSATISVGGGVASLGAVQLVSEGLGAGSSPASGSGELGALAGNGFGGEARLTFSGGSTQATALLILADGQGGRGTDDLSGGTATDGGTGTGGVAQLTSPSGSSGQLTALNVVIVGSGAGGAGGTSSGGTDGNGGDGIGGTAATQLADGAFALGPVTLGADGVGGDGAVGGRGTGGSANFALVDTSGPVGARTTGALSLYGNGTGGTGAGGTGPSVAGSTGLDVEAADSGSGLTIGGDLTVEAKGATAPAGEGFVAMIGGAPLQVNGNTSITTSRDARMSGTQQFHTTGDLTIAARSFSASAPLAADGKVAIVARNGISLGSLTSGGTTGLTANNGDITAANLQSAGLVTASGRSLLLESGAGLTFASAAATAGDLQIGTTAGLTANGPVSATGNVSLIGNGGLTAGTVTSGGTTTLRAPNGAVTVTDLHSPGVVAASGQSVDITSPGALTFSEAAAGAGDLVLTALDLTATGPFSASGNATIGATNGISLGALTSGGTTDLTATNGAISATDLRSGGAATATGRSIDITSGGGLSFASATATAGDLAISTALGLTATGPLVASGNVALSGDHGISAGTVTSGGTTSLTAVNGAIGVSDLNSPGAVTASGESIDITSPGALNFTTASTTGALSVTTNGNLTLTSVDAGGSVALTDNAGGLTISGNFTGGNSTLKSVGDLSVGGNITSGALTVDTRGAFSVGGDASTGDANIVADTGISMPSLTATDNVLLQSSDGDVLVNDLVTPGSITATGGNVTIGSSAGLRFAGVTAAGDASLTASGGDVEGDGDISANGLLSISASGSFILNAAATGATISVSSNDIQLAGESQLGMREVTQDITLTNSDATRTSTIGGAGGAGGYELDSAEAGRLFADQSITLATSGDVSMGDLQLSFSPTGNIGTGGSFDVQSGGVVTVNGAVQLTTSSDTDTFSIDPTLIDVVAGQGSIAMLSGSNAPQGTLSLAADTIAVMDPATLSGLSGSTSLTQTSMALDKPGSPVPTGGYLQAGTIVANVTDAFLIQNGGVSDAFADRRGFTANALQINTESGSTQIAINGVMLESGSPITGLGAAPLVTINGKPAAAGGQFDPLSTINGCAIGSFCLFPASHVGSSTNPTNDDLTDPLQQGSQIPSGQVFSSALIELGDNAPLITPPLVDEPITGVGNDDLWVTLCADPDKDCSKK